MNRRHKGLETGEDHGIQVTLGIMVMILFTPAFPLPGNLPSVRMEEVFLPVMLVILMSRRRQVFRVMKQPMSILLVLFGISMGISMGNGVLLHGRSLSFSDLMELVRVLKYLIFYVFIVTMVSGTKKRENMEGTLIRFVNRSVVILLIINWAQYFNLLYFNRWFSSLYGPAHHVERIIRNSRVIGTFGNPNFFGALMMMLLLFYFSRTIFQFDSVKKEPAKTVLPFAAAWMSLLMTASRTAILSTVAGFLVVMAVYLILEKGKRIRRLTGLLGMMLLIGFFSNLFIVGTMTVYDDYLRPGLLSSRQEEGIDDRSRLRTTHTVGYRVQDAFNEGRSIRNRLDVWAIHLEIAKESLIIGHGPQKEEFRDDRAVDNEYLLILRRYGLLGLVIYLGIYLHTLLKLPGGSRSKWYFGFLFASTLSLMAFNLTAGSFYHLQLFPAYIGFVGLYDGMQNSVV